MDFWFEFVDTNTIGDDDDLVNDPEYVAAAEKELGKLSRGYRIYFSLMKN